MSHYYHIYPGDDRRPMVMDSRQHNGNNGVNGNFSSNGNMVLVQDVSPTTTDGPIHFPSPTPPPPGDEAYPPWTPEGVLTQVQKRRSPMRELNVSDNDNLPIRAANNILDRARDRSPLDASQRSNLTGDFSGFSMREKRESVLREQEESEIHFHLHSQERNIPDFLTKVLTRTATLNEEQKIAEYEYQDSLESSSRCSTSAFSSVMELPQRRHDLFPNPRPVNKVPLHPGCSTPIPVVVTRSGHFANPPTDGDGYASSPSPPPRSSSKMGSAILHDLEDSGRIQRSPEIIGSHRERESQSSNTQASEFSVTPSYLSEEKVQRLLGSLSPIPISQAIGRQSDEGIHTSSISFFLSSPAVVHNITPVGKKSLPTRTMTTLHERKDESESQKSLPDRDDEPLAQDIYMDLDSDQCQTLTPSQMGSSSVALEISSAVRQVRHALVKFVDGEIVPTGMEQHHFPPVLRSDIEHDTQGSINMDKETMRGQVRITVPEVIAAPSMQHNVTIECNGVAKFLLVAQNALTSKWSIPSRERFHDVINKVENNIRSNGFSCRCVLEWCSEWDGGVGLMGLKVHDVKKLETFRNVVAQIRIGSLWYNTYPKDALAQGTEISIILRSELRALDLEWVPHSLFERNTMLAGSMTLKYSKSHSEDDSQANDLTTKDCRTVIIEGDNNFFGSLQRYPHNYSFKLGSSSVRFKLDRDVETINLARTSSSSTSTSSVFPLPNVQPTPSSSSQRTPAPVRGRSAGRGGKFRGKIRKGPLPFPPRRRLK